MVRLGLETYSDYWQYNISIFCKELLHETFFLTFLAFIKESFIGPCLHNDWLSSMNNNNVWTEEGEKLQRTQTSLACCLGTSETFLSETPQSQRKRKRSGEHQSENRHP